MGIAFAALVLLALAIVPVSVSAADLGYDYSGGNGFSDYGGGYDYSGGNGYSDFGGYEYSGGNGYYEPSYSSYPSYSSGYSYGLSGMSYGVPSGYSYNSSSAASSVYAPTNTCTAPNSCNDNSVFNAPIVTTINDVETSDNDDDRCRRNCDRDRDYDNDCRNCGVSYNPPVYYPQAPYVSLAQVPYTGLELGTTGTILYWSFLVIWCLVAAYLIVVKRVQNTLLAKLNAFLFGDAPVTSTSTRSYVKYTAPVATAEKKTDAADDFILSQVFRSQK